MASMPGRTDRTCPIVPTQLIDLLPDFWHQESIGSLDVVVCYRCRKRFRLHVSKRRGSLVGWSVLTQAPSGDNGSATRPIVSAEQVLDDLRRALSVGIKLIGAHEVLCDSGFR